MSHAHSQYGVIMIYHAKGESQLDDVQISTSFLKLIVARPFSMCVQCFYYIQMGFNHIKNLAFVLLWSHPDARLKLASVTLMIDGLFLPKCLWKEVRARLKNGRFLRRTSNRRKYGTVFCWRGKKIMARLEDNVIFTSKNPFSKTKI